MSITGENSFSLKHLVTHISSLDVIWWTLLSLLNDAFSLSVADSLVSLVVCQGAHEVKSYIKRGKKGVY